MLLFSTLHPHYTIYHLFVKQYLAKKWHFVAIPDFPLDKRGKIEYTTKAEKAPFFLPYGGVMVSTGILRYDKRGGQDNPVKMSTFKIKRQENSCNGCLIDCPSGLSISGAVAL